MNNKLPFCRGVRTFSNNRFAFFAARIFVFFELNVTGIYRSENNYCLNKILLNEFL